MPASDRKKVHSAGWISLAALAVSNVAPPILVPLLVTTGLVFAAMALRAGSHVVGTVGLCLSLLQGWLVMDHFGQVSGALGLVSAADADANAAARYASASVELPGNWREAAQGRCREQWPIDLDARARCIEKQEKGASSLAAGVPPDVDGRVFRVIRGRCAEESPRDLSMRADCERKQYDAYLALKATPRSESTRNRCAQKWPSDYSMRQSCETGAR